MSGERSDDDGGARDGDRSAVGPAPAAGPDAAAAALGRAREAARARGLHPGSRPPRRRGTVPGTGPGFPEQRSRDPQLVGDQLGRLMAEHGWTAPLSVGSVMGRWREIVGDVADHAEPETFTDGKLVVRAASTAWATQLGLLLPQLQRRLDEEIGEGVITEIVVLGPGAPSWIRGPRVVPGRGPRDTYG
ncbi:DUF721 domain-containing protein [Litorihabitans aurantiacus]|uniref:DUF721 domain-containing protein n=1 Tax=Litorihabitans aurantiacus TaxID=1930061 RepID=A0AA37XGY3_9MICO|nr:DciA family protein [Litorihabitans aurantiacus]GMA33092.1 hypothetical protein GCM10025875_30840 [Litorihabitans aurantiacus]